MCGICGTINVGTEKRLQKMVDLLKHRGPDDQFGGMFAIVIWDNLEEELILR